MDVEALVEAPFINKNGENGYRESPRERFAIFPRPLGPERLMCPHRVASSSRSHHRSPTPSSEYSRHSSSRHRKDYDRHRDRDDKDYHRDDSRHRRDYDDRRSGSHSRHRDEKYYDDRDRYEKRYSDDRYRRDDRRRSRSRYEDEYDDDRHSKRRREYDDRERSKTVDDRNHREPHFQEAPPPQSARFSFTQSIRLTIRDPSPQLTEEERDQRTIFVQQLAARLRTKELIKFFEKAGPVREAQIVKDRISGRSKGYLHSTFFVAD